MDDSEFLVFVKNIDEKLNVKKVVETVSDQLPLIKTLVPVTPANKETELQSRLTLVDSSPENEDDLCHTPVDNKFNPFAPGPEELCNNAPRAMKLEEKSRILVMRRLSFEDDGSSEDGVKVDPSNDEVLLETVYDDLLEVIISSQETGFLGVDDAYKTPNSAKRLTGIAETCPGAPAPVIGSRKSRKIDQSLCRKLEF